MIVFRLLARPSLMVLMTMVLIMWISAMMIMMTTTAGGGRRGRGPSHFSRLGVEVHISPLFRPGSEDRDIAFQCRIVVST